MGAKRLGITKRRGEVAYSVDEHRDEFENRWDQAMERLHPITRKLEPAVDVEIATVVPLRLGAQCLENLGLVQPFGDPV